LDVWYYGHDGALWYLRRHALQNGEKPKELLE